MRTACLQMCSGENVTANLRIAADLLEKAAGQGAKLAVLPENFALMSPNPGARQNLAEEVSCSTVLPFLAESAARYGMHIIGGSLLLQGDGGRLRNACPVFGPDGACLACYDKIHLFDVDLPGESHRESETIAPGLRPVSVNIAGWTLGFSICYDLRFPELYRHYAREGCQLLSVPAAFTVPTGRAHWEILLRARAIENQAYVLAAAQAGNHPGGRKTWGHSMIVDPWGEILACVEEEEEKMEGNVLIAEIDRDRVEQVRRQLPSLAHRRLNP
ncbi:MAG: carbon-nitrogen hydrolase family protein [Syntrophotaleaceae bacterium]